jgi:VanZ family protein
MKRLAAALGIFILIIIVLADRGQLGLLGVIYEIPYGDKVGHFLLFGLLNLLINLAAFDSFRQVRPFTLAVRVDAVQMVLMALEELSQNFFPERTASIWDVVAGYVGVMVFTGIALLIARRRRASPSTPT